MKFYTIDTSYVEELHKIDPQVFYDPYNNYNNKPYIGTVIMNNNYNYFIPLTSAKPRHLKWNNASKFNYVVYESLPLNTLMPSDAIYTQTTNNIKHILAVLEIRKMIPVPTNYCSYVDFNSIPDTAYRDLLTKEYNFLKPLEQTIISKALSIYENQKNTGIIDICHCNYSELEKVYDKHMLLIQAQPQPI